ncbi:MarR family transcriptional regulator [Kitasatospora sp. NBC_00240]|uniref:helix-turn-helix transcriptional regulator n=1 Tax=Kitasatospora sp. NBC_00240 TaxID=2903567 RepID=UPI0022552007|nr:helix-turn-helix domain-containing protein [Kitasatospora sp. NBC_00240]MCX5215298.1 MarR family transcriptional regulator [Kitasatospora sp. NBC_00240]
MQRSDQQPVKAAAERQEWTFLTSHARVLVIIARDPTVRLRDVAAICQVTERTVQAIVADLEEAGYLVRSREGRRNHYTIPSGGQFRHAAEAGQEISGLLALLARPATPTEDSDGNYRA